MIKKLTRNLLLASTILFLSPRDGFSQSEMKNALKITPIAFTKGQLAVVHFERVVFNNMTLGIGLAPIISGPIIGSLLYPVDEFNSGIAIDPEIRWYAKSDYVMDGFFFGLYNSTRFSSWESSTTLSSGFGSNLPLDISTRRSIYGIQLGTHRLLGDNFSIDFYGGLGLSSTKYDAKYRDTDQLYETEKIGGFNLRLNFALGYQF